MLLYAINVLQQGEFFRMLCCCVLIINCYKAIFYKMPIFLCCKPYCMLIINFSRVNFLSWTISLLIAIRCCELIISCSKVILYRVLSRPRWLSWMRRPTGDQEVAGSTPAEVGNILSWRLIMKYFLRSFSPFRWFKKGSCQFLAKECAQYWLTA